MSNEADGEGPACASGGRGGCAGEVGGFPRGQRTPAIAVGVVSDGSDAGRGRGEGGVEGAGDALHASAGASVAGVAKIEEEHPVRRCARRSRVRSLGTSGRR